MARVQRWRREAEGAREESDHAAAERYAEGDAEVDAAVRLEPDAAG